MGKAEVASLGGLAILALGVTVEFVPATSIFHGYSGSLYVLAVAWWIASLIHFAFVKVRERERVIEESSTLARAFEAASEAAVADTIGTDKKRPELSRTIPAANTSRIPDQALADWLTEKYEDGIHKLLNGPIETDAELAALATADDAWVREISYELIRHGCSRQEYVDFAYLQEVPIEPRLHAEATRDHRRRMINVRLNRLKKAIDRYSDRPTFNVAPYPLTRS